MKSQYLDFVPVVESEYAECMQEHGYNESDVLVYTKKTRKRILVGFIRNLPRIYGESKFYPKDNIYFGKHCLLALSRYMGEMDRRMTE